MTRRHNNNQWRGGIASQPSRLKKIRGQKTTGKFLASIFCYQRRVLLSLLLHFKDIVEEKCRGNFTKFVLTLHENAPAHRALATQKKMDYQDFQCLDHPPYSPDLALSDYHLFPGLKKIENCHFRGKLKSMLSRGPGWMDNILIFFLSDLKNLEQRAKKFIELLGNYVE